MSRIRLDLAYDGGAYQGWQVQPGAASIQGVLEAVLARVYGVPVIRIVASGRTDRGVHAVGQVVHYDEPTPRGTRILGKALSALTPPDIQVWRVREVEDGFHARYSARKRVYGYRILERSNPFNRRYGWHPPFDFDPARAEALCGMIIGKRDFRHFSTRPDPGDEYVCDIMQADWTPVEGGWQFTVTADRFLRRMVRTLVGSLVEVAAGRLEESVLRERDAERIERVGAPAPPQGLALLRVHYDTDDNWKDAPSSPWSLFP